MLQDRLYPIINSYVNSPNLDTTNQPCTGAFHDLDFPRIDEDFSLFPKLGSIAIYDGITEVDYYTTCGDGLHTMFPCHDQADLFNAGTPDDRVSRQPLSSSITAVPCQSAKHIQIWMDG
jgi:hypothetical protein